MKPAWHPTQVITFRPDGSVEQTVQTSEALGLAPRDVSLFAPRPAGLSTQRATIAPREDAVLIRTEIAAAIVKHDAAYIFPCRCTPRLFYMPSCRKTPLSTTLSGVRARLGAPIHGQQCQQRHSGKACRSRGRSRTWSEECAHMQSLFRCQAGCGTAGADHSVQEAARGSCCSIAEVADLAG